MRPSRAPLVVPLNRKTASGFEVINLKECGRQRIKTNASLQQFAPDAISLFNNMKGPASMLANGIALMSFSEPLPAPPKDKKEGQFARFLRQAYVLAFVIAISSDLLCMTWATVAVNQLTENVPARAVSVWELLSRDYSLSWAATNVHFVLAILSFMWMLLTRGYLAKTILGVRLGRACAGFAGSGILLMTAIVNRGVQTGSGDGMRYGANMFSLFSSYIRQFVSRSLAVQSFSFLEISAITVFVASAVLGIMGTFLDRAKED